MWEEWRERVVPPAGTDNTTPRSLHTQLEARRGTAGRGGAVVRTSFGSSATLFINSTISSKRSACARVCVCGERARVRPARRVLLHRREPLWRRILPDGGRPLRHQARQGEGGQPRRPWRGIARGPARVNQGPCEARPPRGAAPSPPLFDLCCQLPLGTRDREGAPAASGRSRRAGRVAAGVPARRAWPGTRTLRGRP